MWDFRHCVVICIRRQSRHQSNRNKTYQTASWDCDLFGNKIGMDEVTARESFEQVVLQLLGLVAVLMIHAMARLILIHALYVDGGLANARRVSFRALSYLDTRHGAGEGHSVRRVASEPTGGDQDGDHSSK